MSDMVLHGTVIEEDASTATIRAQKATIERLQGELEDARQETEIARRQAARSVAALRQRLQPLYAALQMVFGEIEAVAGVDEQSAPAATQAPTGGPALDPRVTSVWESWKQRLGVGSAPARLIDALLVHGDLSVSQAKVAGQMAQQTVYDAAAKLKKLGLINSAGGRYSLKKL